MGLEVSWFGVDAAYDAVLVYYHRRTHMDAAFFVEDAKVTPNLVAREVADERELKSELLCEFASGGG